MSRVLRVLAVCLVVLSSVRSVEAAPGPAAQASSAPTVPDAAGSALSGAIGPIASVPLFGEIAAEPDLLSYSVPVQIDVTIRKFFFSFSFRRHGVIRFEEPDTLRVSLVSVPQRYTDVFGDLGTARTWPVAYDLELEGSVPSTGSVIYRVSGVPRRPMDVEQISILSGDPTAPIDARWLLRSGWTISSTIETQDVGRYLLPKHDAIDIVGHGLKIHAEMNYGEYLLNDGT